MPYLPPDQPVAAYVEALGISVCPALRERLGRFERHDLARGEHLVREGAIATSIAFVLRGQVRHYYLVDGREHTRWVALAGNFTVSFKSFAMEVPSRVNLVCDGPAEVLLVRRARFYALLAEFEAMRRMWTSCLEREMAKYEDRVTQLITADTTTRYLDFVRDYPNHALEVPQKHIAAMLGVAPRHLSRVRARLAAAPK